MPKRKSITIPMSLYTALRVVTEIDRTDGIGTASDRAHLISALDNLSRERDKFVNAKREREAAKAAAKVDL